MPDVLIMFSEVKEANVCLNDDYINTSAVYIV